MSKLRSVDTVFWTDPYIQDCTPDEKLIFLYFLTNPLTNLAGVYEISKKQIAFDTDLPTDEVGKAIEKFISDRKALYVDGFIILPNHSKHQKLNESMRINIERVIKSLPDSVRSAVREIETGRTQAADRVDAPRKEVKEKVKKEVEKEPTKSAPAKPKPEGATLHLRATNFRKDVFDIGLEKYGKPMISAFVDYWNEPNRSHTILRHEGEKYFDISRRLSTWSSREKDLAPAAGQKPKRSAEVDRILKEDYSKYNYKRSGESKPIGDIIDKSKQQNNGRNI